MRRIEDKGAVAGERRHVRQGFTGAALPMMGRMAHRRCKSGSCMDRDGAAMLRPPAECLPHPDAFAAGAATIRTERRPRHRFGRTAQFEAMRVLNERRRGDFLLTVAVLGRELQPGHTPIVDRSLKSSRQRSATMAGI